ncbi:hypothetical protein PR202_ga01811 [Eleusine coracana subsp. coracana]|uniref:Uncharacterized protein n=1 Tax=Eleusine coracana subsp. coracana TaxID=191504 RepID=A0AAV5BG08_ELECO|nr:hypothetical protein PR202_ga01124 [Eleusine coracana subsp. coracana]GJM85994.1 hypothetical protein PR202_ga01811 [Eleusine coracana subsp. coracana]
MAFTVACVLNMGLASYVVVGNTTSLVVHGAAAAAALTLRDTLHDATTSPCSAPCTVVSRGLTEKMAASVELSFDATEQLLLQQQQQQILAEMPRAVRSGRWLRDGDHLVLC